MRTVEGTPERLQAFLETAEAGQPIVMINLLRYRDRAEYEAGFDAEPCSGREAYGRYGAESAKLIAEVSGRLLWFGHVTTAVIAPDDEQWDDAILVEYPSPQAFVEMIESPAYRAIMPHRSAALLDSRLISTRTLAMAKD